MSYVRALSYEQESAIKTVFQHHTQASLRKVHFARAHHMCDVLLTFGGCHLEFLKKMLKNAIVTSVRFLQGNICSNKKQSRKTLLNRTSRRSWVFAWLTMPFCHSLAKRWGTNNGKTNVTHGITDAQPKKTRPETVSRKTTWGLNHFTCSKCCP